MRWGKKTEERVKAQMDRDIVNRVVEVDEG